MNKPDRQTRLAAALRENLKRRKRQTRDRVREAQGDASAPSEASLADAGIDTGALSPPDSDGADKAQD